MKLKHVAGIALVAVALSGCSTVKGWFAGKDAEAKKALEPAELVKFEPTLKVNRIWSANVGKGEGRIGVRQAHYMPAIAEALRRSPEGRVRLHLAPGAQAAWWMTQVSFVERQPVRGHVRFVPADAPADATVTADGSLVPDPHAPASAAPRPH